MSEARARRSTRWLLPAVIALPFVAAVVVDVARVLTAEPARDRDLLEISALRFDPADPVFDLRRDPVAAEEAWAGPGYALVSGWGQAVVEGRWTAAGEAQLRLEAGAGGQRVLLVEGRADRGERVPILLAAAVNGVDCGRARLERHLAVCRYALPEGAVRPGANSVELEVVDARTARAAPGRTALIRRRALTSEGAASFAELAALPPLVVDRSQGTVLVRRAGRLTAPFSPLVSGSVLSGHVTFRAPTGDAWCRVTVARRYSGPERFDVVSERMLRPGRSPTASFRQELRDRQEPVALIVDVNPAAAAGGVVLDELRVAVDRRR
jgi:hypothetical protein